MKTFTKEEIQVLENSLVTMVEAHKEIVLEEVTQDNLDELVELFNMIVGEHASCLGKTAKILAPQDISELTEGTLNNLITILTEASAGLVEIAKQNVVA